MAVLAFYTGHGNWLDRLIRWVTGAPFSHVELISTPTIRIDSGKREIQSGLCISASARDGGVRKKNIIFRPGRWLFLDCHWVTDDPAKTISAELGAKYDYFGIVMSQILNLGRHNKKRWFCSEIIGHALGIHEAHRVSPSDLWHRVNEMNGAYKRGILEALKQQ